MDHPALLTILCALTASGCQGERTAPIPAQSRPMPGATTAVDGPPGTLEPRRDPPARSLERADVTWPDAATIDRAALAELAQGAATAVRASPVPVLVPTRTELLRGAVILAKPDWYSVAAREPGLTITLQATRVAHRYPHIPETKGTRRVRGADGSVTQNEGIWSATWKENGASYSLEVECADPSDARCSDESFLLGLGESLAYVGGAGVAR